MEYSAARRGIGAAQIIVCRFNGWILLCFSLSLYLYLSRSALYPPVLSSLLPYPSLYLQSARVEAIYPAILTMPLNFNTPLPPPRI